MRFRPATILSIAKCICGDEPTPFPYRTGNDLSEFFIGLGFDLKQQGQSRNQYAQTVLTGINLKSPVEETLPSREIVTVMEELMNRDYFDGSTQERVNYKEAINAINKILTNYELEIIESRSKGLAELVKSNGDYISSVLGTREAVRKITFCPSVFSIPAEEVAQDLVAVMMPFAAEFTPVYKTIAAACDQARLRYLRADDIWNNSTIIQDVFQLIFTSAIVIVDFTSKNPNVMYETGIAHTLGKYVVPITQSMDDVPFDLKQHRVLKYLPNFEGLSHLEVELTRRLITIKEQNIIFRT